MNVCVFRWVLISAVLIAIILGIIALWLLLSKQSDEICCSTLEQAKRCSNPKCKLRQQLFDKIKKLLGE